MKPIRVPIPCKLVLIDDTHAVVRLFLVQGSCDVVFTGWEADKMAQNYYEWVGNPDPSS